MLHKVWKSIFQGERRQFSLFHLFIHSSISYVSFFYYLSLSIPIFCHLYLSLNSFSLLFGRIKILFPYSKLAFNVTNLKLYIDICSPTNTICDIVCSTYMWHILYADTSYLNKLNMNLRRKQETKIFSLTQRNFYNCFQAHMKFPLDYPYSPPSIRFLTKVWHPNVYEVSNLVA